MLTPANRFFLFLFENNRKFGKVLKGNEVLKMKIWEIFEISEEIKVFRFNISCHCAATNYIFLKWEKFSKTENLLKNFSKNVCWFKTFYLTLQPNS